MTSDVASPDVIIEMFMDQLCRIRLRWAASVLANDVSQAIGTTRNSSLQAVSLISFHTVIRLIRSGNISELMTE